MDIWTHNFRVNRRMEGLRRKEFPKYHTYWLTWGFTKKVLLSTDLKPIHAKLIMEKPYYANDSLNAMCEWLNIHQPLFYCTHNIPRNECNAFSQTLLTDTSIPYKFVFPKFQRHPHSLQMRNMVQRVHFYSLEKTVPSCSPKGLVRCHILSGSPHLSQWRTLDILTLFGLQHLQNMPLPTPFTCSSSCRSWPLRAGLLEETPLSPVLYSPAYYLWQQHSNPLASEFYILQNLLRILRSFSVCIYQYLPG